MADNSSNEPGISQPTEKEAMTQHFVDVPVLDENGEPPRPSGWMYKSFRAGKLYIPWYASPRFQLVMVSFVCFMCPGMFNALSGMGGGGKADPGTADDMVINPLFSFVRVSQGLC